ncbi:MAG TPA: hypothetical protein VF852_17440 [Pseudolabrys sp.]
MFAAPVFHRRKRSDAFCEWITAFSQAMAEYDYGMIKTSLNVDLMRLRQFLKALESDAQIALADVDLGGHEIEILKREIAEIEGVLNGSPDHGSRAFLFRIPIDYSTHRVHGV